MNKTLPEKKLTGNFLLVGSPGRDADLAYVTGFNCPDDVVFLKKGKTKYLVLSALEFGRARQETRGIKILSPDMLDKQVVASEKGVSGWAHAILRFAGVKEVLVPSSFSLGLAESLRRHGYRLQVAKQKFFPQRETKNRQEIEDIRHAQKAAVLAVKKAVEMLAAAAISDHGKLAASDGLLTSEKIRRAMNHVLLENDCIPSADIIVAGAARSALPHDRGSGPIVARSPIVIDIFPKSAHRGYWGDLTRTFFKGKPDRDLRRLYSVVREAQKTALEKVRAGVSSATVHDSVCKLFEKKGLPTGVDANGEPYGFIHSTGHGVGLEIHETPRVSRIKGKKLRRGNVITIEPGYYLPGIGGIRIEDTVLVTGTGYELLCPCHVSPWIK